MKKLFLIIAVLSISLIGYSQGYPVLVDDSTPLIQITAEQDWHAADSTQRTYVISKWIKGKPIHAVRPDRSGMRQSTVKWFYHNMNGAVQLTMQLMRGEVLIYPAVYEDGELVKDAVYNVIPDSPKSLRLELRKAYPDFYNSEIKHFIDYFILASGCGTWNKFQKSFK